MATGKMVFMVTSGFLYTCDASTNSAEEGVTGTFNWKVFRRRFRTETCSNKRELKAQKSLFREILFVILYPFEDYPRFRA